MADNFDRFRSFAERYVISRAASFRVGYEEEDGYMAVLQARTIYNNIQVQSESPVVCDNRPLPDRFGNGSVGASSQASGATGAMRPNPAHNSSKMASLPTPTQMAKRIAGAKSANAALLSKHHSEVTATVKARSGGLSEMIRNIMGKESSNGTP